MSASQASALTAIAFQLAASLEAYEEDLDRLLQMPTDPDLYQRVNRHVDDMRMYSAALPSLSVAWIEVLIRHFEMAQGLWRVQQGACSGADLARQQEQLAGAVARLRQLCLRTVAAS